MPGIWLTSHDTKESAATRPQSRPASSSLCEPWRLILALRFVDPVGRAIQSTDDTLADCRVESILTSQVAEQSVLILADDLVVVLL